LIGHFDNLGSLLPEGAAFSQSAFSTGWLAEDSRTGTAKDDGLCVGKDNCDIKASWTFDVHEV